jgi:hypothetical protein
MTHTITKNPNVAGVAFWSRVSEDPSAPEELKALARDADTVPVSEARLHWVLQYAKRESPGVDANGVGPVRVTRTGEGA